MAKKVTKFIKLQIPAGAANPAPPVGPALGAAGVNIMQFCQAFNAATKDKSGDIIPVAASSPRSSSPRSPRSRCRTSTPTTSRPPRRSSPAPPVPWASPSPSSVSHHGTTRLRTCGGASLYQCGKPQKMWEGASPLTTGGI